MAKTTEELLQELITEFRGFKGTSSNFGSSRSYGSDVDFSKLSSGLGSALGQTTNYIQESYSTWKKASDLGVGFGNDIIGLSTSIQQTRMSADEWGKALTGAGSGLTALGGTMNASVKGFNILSTELGSSPIADKLRTMAYTTGEYNELLAITIAGNTKLNLNDAKSKAELFQSVERLGVEFDAVAQISGKSRTEQMKRLEESKRDSRLLAALELEKMQGGKKAEVAFDQAFASLAKIGRDKLIKELYVDRGLSEQSQGQIAALGTAGTELQNALRNLKEAGKSGNDYTIAEAQDRIKAAEAGVAARMQEKSYLEMISTQHSKMAEVESEAYVNSRAYRDSLGRMVSDLGLTEKEAAKVTADQVKNYQVGKDVAGKTLEGAKSTELIILANARLKDATAALANTIEATNIRIGKSNITTTAISAAKNVDTNGVGFKERIDSKTAPLNESIINGTLTKDLPNILGTALKDGLSALKDIGITASNVYLTGNTEKKEHLAEGTKDVFGGSNPGNWFFDAGPKGKDVTFGEAGPEAIVPKNKVPEFINDIFGGDFAKTMSGMGTPMANQMAGMASTMEGKISQLEKQFPSMVTGLIDQQSKMASTSMPKDIKMPDMSSLLSGIMDTIKQQTPKIQQVPAEPARIPSPIFPTSALDELKDQLVQLNRTMVQVSGDMNELVSNSVRQNQLTKKQSPNLNTR